MSAIQYYLQVLAGPNISDLHPVGRPEYTIGRSRDNLIVIGGPAVSRHHATLYVAGHHVLIEDMGSSYGTLVNGERLEPLRIREIQLGDQVALGNIPVRLVGLNDAGQPDLEPLPEYDEPLTATSADSVITDFESEVVHCPACNAENYETDFVCIECGAAFEK